MKEHFRLAWIGVRFLAGLALLWLAIRVLPEERISVRTAEGFEGAIERLGEDVDRLILENPV